MVLDAYSWEGGMGEWLCVCGGGGGGGGAGSVAGRGLYIIILSLTPHSRCLAISVTNDLYILATLLLLLH